MTILSEDEQIIYNQAFTADMGEILSNYGIDFKPIGQLKTVFKSIKFFRRNVPSGPQQES